MSPDVCTLQLDAIAFIHLSVLVLRAIVLWQDVF